jgi:hypothetical protein
MNNLVGKQEKNLSSLLRKFTAPFFFTHAINKKDLQEKNPAGHRIPETNYEGKFAISRL